MFWLFPLSASSSALNLVVQQYSHLFLAKIFTFNLKNNGDEKTKDTIFTPGKRIVISLKYIYLSIIVSTVTHAYAFLMQN